MDEGIACFILISECLTYSPSSASFAPGWSSSGMRVKLRFIQYDGHKPQGAAHASALVMIPSLEADHAAVIPLGTAIPGMHCSKTSRSASPLPRARGDAHATSRDADAVIEYMATHS
jgi:hypothetical protein